MALRDTLETFGAGSRAFHWIMAVLIIAAVLIGRFMPEVQPGDPRGTLLDRHTAFGMAVLALVVLRLLWRLTNPTPEPVAGTSPLQHLAARGAHAFLYLLMFALPVTGTLMNWAEGRTIHVFWLHDIPAPYGKNPELGEMLEMAHEILAGALVLTVLAHAAAALYHHFVCRDCTLRRMLTGRTG